MAIPQLLEPIPLTNPPEYRLTSEGRKFLEEILQAQYLSRFIRFPLGPRPSPLVFDGDLEPEPQTNIHFEDVLQRSLVGELLINAIGSGDPNTQPSRISIVNVIKKEKLDVKVVQGLIGELESGIKMLKDELFAIQK